MGALSVYLVSTQHAYFEEFDVFIVVCNDSSEARNRAHNNGSKRQKQKRIFLDASFSECAKIGIALERARPGIIFPPKET